MTTRSSGAMVKRASYREACFWIARNDDTEWLRNNEDTLSVTASLVQDLFGVTTERLLKDLRRELKKVEADHA